MIAVTLCYLLQQEAIELDLDNSGNPIIPTMKTPFVPSDCSCSLCLKTPSAPLPVCVAETETFLNAPVPAVNLFDPQPHAKIVHPAHAGVLCEPIYMSWL